jgi:hypothetical protein
MRDERCDGCRHWWPSGPDDWGECRRNPPSIHTDLASQAGHKFQDRGFWPMTLAHDWCGEFLAAPALVPAGQGACKP